MKYRAFFIVQLNMAAISPRKPETAETATIITHATKIHPVLSWGLTQMTDENNGRLLRG
jgi:hypothetical protein